MTTHLPIYIPVSPALRLIRCNTYLGIAMMMHRVPIVRTYNLTRVISSMHLIPIGLDGHDRHSRCMNNYFLV